MEAVYRDMMDDVPGLGSRAVDVFCIEGLSGADPEIGLLTRLAQSDSRVRPRSECTIESASPYHRRMIETATGRASVALNIASVRCDTPQRCTVHCGYFAGDMSASGNNFEIEKRGAAWVVVSRDMVWIS